MDIEDIIRGLQSSYSLKSTIHSLTNELEDCLWPSVLKDQLLNIGGLLSQVEKNDMLRGVFARNMEGLVRSTVTLIRSEALNARYPSYRSFCDAVDFTFDQEDCLANLESLVVLFLTDLSSGVGSVYNALVSAIVLSIVFQYLVGYVDKGGTKTYNPGSLEFRATYVSLLLFLGAYVWIKFREVAKRTVRRRHKKDKFGKVLKDEVGQVQYYDKWEPRFKPPVEIDFANHNYLPLGGYDTEKDAKVVCQIAGFYYGKDERVVAMEDGSPFSIPEMSEQERSFCGEQKREWVSAKAREVFESFKRMAVREQPLLGAHTGDQVHAPAAPSADEATPLSAHAADQDDAPAAPSADEATPLSAHAADHVDAPAAPSANEANPLSAHAGDRDDAPAAPSADEAIPLSAHPADQVDAPASPSAGQLAADFFPSVFNEFAEGLPTPLWEHGPSGSIGVEGIHLDFDVPMLSNHEEFNEQLHLQKKQLEADFNQRIERLMEQHAEQCRRLEVEKSELRQEISDVRQENSELREENLEVRRENKRLKTITQHAAETAETLRRKLQNGA